MRTTTAMNYKSLIQTSNKFIKRHEVRDEYDLVFSVLKEAKNALLREEAIDVFYNMFRFGFVAGYHQAVEEIMNPSTTNEDGTAICNYKADIIKQLDHLTQQQRRYIGIIISDIVKENAENSITVQDQKVRN